VIMDKKPAIVYPVGEYLRDELEARGWTPIDFAGRIGWPVHLVSQIINGERGITVRSAIDIGGGLGTSAELWINLDTAYKLWKLRNKDK